MKGFCLRLLRLVMPLNGWIVLAVLLGCATIGSSIGLMATSAYLISAAALHPSVAAALVGIGMWFFLGAYAVSVSLVWLVCFLLAGLVVPLLTYLLSKKLGQRTIALRAELHVQVLDGVQGMADLMAFGQEAAYLTRIELLNRKLVRAQAWMSRIASVQSTLSNTLMNLVQWAVLVVAIPLVLDGKISGIFLTVLVLTSAASFEAVLPLSSACQQIGSIQEATRVLFSIAEY